MLLFADLHVKIAFLTRCFLFECLPYLEESRLGSDCPSSRPFQSDAAGHSKYCGNDVVGTEIDIRNVVNVLSFYIIESLLNPCATRMFKRKQIPWGFDMLLKSSMHIWRYAQCDFLGEF